MEQVWKYNVEDQTGQESIRFTSKANGLPRGQSRQSELPPFLIKFFKGQVGRKWVILVPEEVKNTEAIQDYEVQGVLCLLPVHPPLSTYTICLLYSCLTWLYNISILLTEVTVCWWIMGSWQCVYFIYLPGHCCQVICSPRLCITFLLVICFMISRSYDFPFCSFCHAKLISFFIESLCEPDVKRRLSYLGFVHLLEILTPLLWLQKHSMFINKWEELSIKICLSEYMFIEVISEYYI